MKKTSLLLAVGALLYGASDVYAIPLTDQEILDILKEYGVVDAADAVAELGVIPEDAEVADVTAAQNPPPANVWVDDKHPVHMTAFCGFQPTGAKMAEFPVSVNGGPAVIFKDFSGVIANSGVAVGGAAGPGIWDWLLFEQGDTWNAKWWLITKIAITSIKIDPLSRTGPGPEKYAFDIIYEPVHSGDSVVGSARGWAITRTSPSPKVSFKATYSRPVLVGGHPNDIFPFDGLLVVENLKDRWNKVGAANTHDMYGTLTIDFTAPALGLVDLPTFFTFRADTDCLPVKEAKFDSYQGGVVNFTLTGDGFAYIAERCGAGSNLVAGPFAVAYRDGAVGFNTSLTPHEGCCYSVVNVADDGTKNTVPLLGVSTNVNNEVCL